VALSYSEKWKTLFDIVRHYPIGKALLSLRHSGYLVDVGWFNAFTAQRSIGKNNEPIPWVTYPFINFITPRLKKKFSVFEFGSGNSTLFYAERVGTVTTVEHDRQWYEKMQKLIPANVTLLFRENYRTGGYSKAILQQNTMYDIIIIDAVDRYKCATYAVRRLTRQGVIILDDSDREEYQEIIKFLHKKKFRQLDFWGISPGYFNTKATTIFYRSKNCLNI
jgi:hypothetical protein